ncbi:MAG: T9SS type A sorting domain-containing protein [Candidatus Methylacidiphilales bacterium]
MMKIQLNRMRSAKLIGLALLTIMIVFQAKAQTANTYQFAASSGTFTPLVGGTATSLVATADDDISTAFPIGFTFVYEGISYTQVMAMSNGPLLFGTGRTQTAANNLATATATQRPGVVALWDDLQCSSGVTYQLSGVAPNRVLTVQWLNMEWNWSSTVALSYQVQLYETTNVINFIYRQEAGGNPAGSGGASIGIMGVASANFISLQNSSASPTISTTASTNNISVKPATGQIYTFSPPPLCSGTPAGGTATLSNIPGCGTGNFNLTGSSPTVLGLTYQWQSSPDGVTYTDLTNDTLVILSKAPVTSLTFFRRNTTCISTTFTGSSNAVIVKPVYGGNTQSTVPICGDSLTLSLTNVSAGVNAFQWLESINNINWTPIFGATLASQKIPSPSVNSFYRAVVTCNASFSTDSSVAVFVKAATGGTTTITASNCSDSTTLGVTGSTTGTGITFNWLISTDSINWTSMGISTATAKFPSPNATRFYRRVVTCGLSSDSSIAVRVNEPCQGFGPYSITRNTGVTYTTIQTTGTQFTWASAFTGDDDNTNKVSMPFPFVYQGAVQSAFYVSTNGWLSFDTATVTNNLTNDLNSTFPRRVIAPLWEDLVTLGNTNANKSLIRYATTGTAPNRVLTVEWAEMERFGYGSPSLNFQVKLFEGSNNIQLVYGRMQPFDGNGTGAFDYSLGLTGNNPASGQKLALLLENSRNFSASAVNNALSILPSCNTSILFTNGGVFNPSNSTPIPSNDSSLNPITLNVNALPCADGCGTYYSTRSATASAVGPNPISGNPDDDVWFQFVAPLSGQVSIATVGSSGFDPAFQVMTNLFDTVGLGIAGSRNISTTALENVQATGLIPSNTYFVRVFNAGAGSGSTSGAFSICINEIIPAPINDDTTGAITLSVGTSCTPVSGTTFGASASSQAVCGGLADDDVWYKFTPSASVDTITVVGLGTFRAHVQVLSRNMTSLTCQNTTVNAGTVKTTVTGLIKDSTYFVRVYHTNAGTGTGNFTICASGSIATAPLVQTNSSTNVIDVTATISGNIISNGGFPVTQSGIIYSTIPGAIKSTFGIIDSVNSPTITSGIFSKNLTGLFASTTYYVRAYAVNAIGITYGGDTSFTTTSGPVAPIVQRVAASNIQAFSATIGGNITSNGGSAVFASGVVYGTTPNPTSATGIDSATSPVATNGIFSINPSGLLSSTKYYFRAYATNSVGVSYSSQDSFTTAPVISSFPYTENFDGTTTAWTTSAINFGTNAWVRGTPAKTTISGAYSSPNAMVTFLTGSYLGTEDCVILSPQFNFNSFTSDPVLRFRHNLKTDNDLDWDGGVIEISINGGAWTRLDATTGAGANFNTTGSFAWYNNTSGNGTLGANKFSGITSSYSSSTSGWVESATRLTGAAGQSNVKIRFRFWADSFVDEGWAIDNVEVVNLTVPTPATSVVLTPNINGGAMNVAFTAGNGQERLVVARLTTVPAVAPFDTLIYTANSVFSAPSPSTTGTGNVIVYKGAGTSVNVTGLTNFTNYAFDVYEYNGKYMHNKFTVAANSSASTLPVKLISFNGVAKNNDALLTWITASETNNKGFEVERSIDGRTFELVNFVKGAGNSNKNLNYTLTDANVLSQLAIVYYRLKQIDFDGKTTYSQVVRVTKNAESMNSMIVFPNPFNNEYNVSFNAAKAGMVTLETVNLEGKVIVTKTTSVTQGANTVPVVEAANLSAGIYFVRLTVDGETQVMKLVKN